MTRSSNYPEQRSRWWLEHEILWLFALVFIALFIRIDALTPRGEESRRANVALEFLRSGDWLIPRQQGEVYFSRPPLQNWLIAVVAWLRGDCDIWAARFPSAVAILLTTLLIYGYARTFLARVGAFAAAAAFATMSQVFHLGGLAETEALFTLFVAGSLLVWHWGYSQRWPEVVTWSAAYTLVALGTLTKGLQAPFFFAASIGLYLILNREVPSRSRIMRLRYLFTKAHLMGLLTFAVLFGLWFVPYTFQLGWDSAWFILGDQAAARFQPENGQTWLLHLITYPLEIFACLLPWSLPLLAYLSPSFRKTVGAAWPQVRFLLLCLLATFPFCWLAEGAETRYWMPLFPCCAILTGLVIERCLEAKTESRLRQWWTLFLTGCCCVLALVPVVALTGGEMELLTGWPLRQPGLLAVGFAVTMSALVGLLFLQRRRFEPFRVQLAVFALASCLALGFSGWFLNILINRSMDTHGAIAQLKEEISGNQLVSFEELHHLFAFCYQEPIPRLPWPEDETDLPPNVKYFCFTAANPPQQLPFAWEKVGAINCDRNPRTQPHWVVIVGRRIPEGQEKNSH